MRKTSKQNKSNYKGWIQPYTLNPKCKPLGYIRGLIFGRIFGLVYKGLIFGGLYSGAYIRGAYIRGFTVFSNLFSNLFKSKNNTHHNKYKLLGNQWISLANYTTLSGEKTPNSKLCYQHCESVLAFAVAE